MKGMLLVNRSGPVEENDVEIFHYKGIQLSSYSLPYGLKIFEGVKYLRNRII